MAGVQAPSSCPKRSLHTLFCVRRICHQDIVYPAATCWGQSALQMQHPLCLSEGSQSPWPHKNGRNRDAVLSPCAPSTRHLPGLAPNSPSGKMRIGSLLLSWTCSVSLNRRGTPVSTGHSSHHQQPTQHVVPTLQSPGTVWLPAAAAQPPNTCETQQHPHPAPLPILQTPPQLPTVTPFGDEVTIFDLRTFKPDVGASLHHGSLNHTHEPPMDLTHLNGAGRHML